MRWPVVRGRLAGLQRRLSHKSLEPGGSVDRPLNAMACRTRAPGRPAASVVAQEPRVWEGPSTGHKMRWPVVRGRLAGPQRRVVAQEPRAGRIRRQATKCDGLSYAGAWQGRSVGCRTTASSWEDPSAPLKNRL